jgi:hypothetical protein
MQVLLSHPIYFHPLSFLSQHSEYTKFLVQGLPRRQVLTILCSFLNITLNSAGTSFSIPYNHLVWKGEDVHGTVVCLSVQSLCALLDYQSNNAKDKEWSSGETAPSTKTNAFRHAIARLVSHFQLETLLSVMLICSIAPLTLILSFRDFQTFSKSISQLSITCFLVLRNQFPIY